MILSPRVLKVRRGSYVLTAILALVACRNDGAQGTSGAPSDHFPAALVGTWSDVISSGGYEWGVRLMKGGYGTITCRCVPAPVLDFKWSASSTQLSLLNPQNGTPMAALPWSVSEDGVLHLSLPGGLTQGQFNSRPDSASLFRASEEMFQDQLDAHRRLAVQSRAAHMF